MVTYELYGVALQSLDEARSVIEGLLGVTFVPRESSYLGAYLLCRPSDSEKLLLRCNTDPIDGQAAEEEFPGEQLLLYVEGMRNVQQWRNVLLAKKNMFKLLRTETR
jgi:hypothetical protein